MNKFVLALLACIVGAQIVANGQTTVIAEELNTNEVKVTWGVDWSLIEDFETGDFSQFKWDNSISDHPWEVCTDAPYEGEYCMKAGNHNILESESAIQVTVDVPFDCNISFYEKISADNGFDCGRFFIDDSLVGLWTAVSDWIKREYEITQGRHTFKWSYTKESGGNWNDDCFWVDYINFCKEPDPIGSTWLSYSTPAYFGNVGSGTEETIWASRWPERELGQYAGYTMTKVGMYSDEEGYTGGEYTVCIHRGATEYTPGEMITTQTVTVPSGLGEYVEYDLDTPVYIDGVETIWIIWHQTGVTMPAPACSEIDYNMDGEWFYQGEWMSLFYGAWMMEFYVLSPDGKEVNLSHAGNNKSSRSDISYFNVYRREGANEPVLVAEQVTDTTYIDMEWAVLEDGLYQWGVSAIYEDNGRNVEMPIHWVGGDPRTLREPSHETGILWSNSIEKNTMGTAENERQISLYPNPTNDNITVKAEDMKCVKVISLLGHVVYEAEVHGDETILNLSQYHDGVYLLCVITGNGTIKKHVTVLK